MRFSHPVGTDVAVADRPTYTVLVNDVSHFVACATTVSMTFTDRLLSPPDLDSAHLGVL